MENLSKLLERFSKILNRDSFIKETIVRVIGENTGVKLAYENFLLKDGVLEILAGASSKNEIRLKEESIKTELALHKIPVRRVLYR